VIFPEGAKAVGWFGVTKIFKETLTEGHKKPSPPPRNAYVPSRFPVANVVRGHLGGSPDSHLMGWKCRDCGSWDVSTSVNAKKSGSKEFLDASSPCVNQFQVLRDLLENFLSSDFECSSHCSSLFASRIQNHL